MKILVTGSSGRVGRAIRHRLSGTHEVIGLDRRPAAGTDLVAAIENADHLARALRGVQTVVHVAALHAPHVGQRPDTEFDAVNVAATAALARLAAAAGVRHVVFTSTTALYGAGAEPDGRAAWIDEDSVPRPQTVYHRSKLAAEARLAEIARDTGLPVTVLRMSRCFPEPAPAMAVYRLHRGVDVRDVAEAHALAVLAPAVGFRRLVVSGRTPFQPEDRAALASDAPAVIARRCPALAEAFRRRGWSLPAAIDRVYVPDRAMQVLGWVPRHGFEAVLAQWDAGSPEVLAPVGAPALE